jgi:hypothetical protein
MSERRHFLRVAAAAALPIGTIVSTGQARGEHFDSPVGAWNCVHSLPFPPGSFREFLSFLEGGVLQETNSFLHTASNLDLSAFGLPNVLNASDGMGNWRPTREGAIHIGFRKLLFNGSRENFGDLHVTGKARINGGKLHVEADVQIVDLSNTVIFDFGAATSDGLRLS